MARPPYPASRFEASMLQLVVVAARLPRARWVDRPVRALCMLWPWCFQRSAYLGRSPCGPVPGSLPLSCTLIQNRILFTLGSGVSHSPRASAKQPVSSSPTSQHEHHCLDSVLPATFLKCGVLVPQGERQVASQGPSPGSLTGQGPGPRSRRLGRPS